MIISEKVELLNVVLEALPKYLYPMCPSVTITNVDLTIYNDAIKLDIDGTSYRVGNNGYAERISDSVLISDVMANRISEAISKFMTHCYIGKN